MRLKQFLMWMIILLIAAGCGAKEDEETAATAVPATAVPPTPLTNTAVPAMTLTPTSNSSDDMAWWNDTVFYEVFVRSFYDSNGDGVGDINGLIEKLDYLNDGDPTTTDDLGITGIWLMPIMESPSYHGYDVTDYYAVDQEYGTQADFQRLMTEAHRRGIRVIVDLVLNHTSVQHPWFTASRDPNSDKRDWYIWSDTDPGFRGPNGQKVWHPTDNGYYYAIFWDGMPDLNYENPDVTAQMLDVTRFWLEEMGVDGFRLDAIKHIVEDGSIQENSTATHAWLQGFYTFYKRVNPEAFAVGEAWTSTQQVLAYTGDEVDIAFQFDLAQDILNSVDVGISSIFAKTEAAVVAAYPPNQYATFITNHDQNRVMSQLDGDEGAARMAASILLTSPGVPFIYYGEEIGMTGSKPDEDIRRPMQWCSDDGQNVCFTSGQPWRSPAPDYEMRSVAIQTIDPDSLLNHYRSLIHLRNAHSALRTGDWTLVNSNPGRVYAFLRHSEEETVLVVLNLSNKPTSDYHLTLETGPLTGPITPSLLFGNGDVSAPDINVEGGFDTYMPLPELPPHSTTIILLAQA